MREGRAVTTFSNRQTEEMPRLGGPAKAIRGSD
jgi:hypothetical protein